MTRKSCATMQTLATRSPPLPAIRARHHRMRWRDRRPACALQRSSDNSMSRYPAQRPVLPTDAGRARHCAEVLKAVAHPLRLRIIAILCLGEEHVSALADRLGEPQAIVSQQLRVLRLRGLVAPECREGFSYYRLTEPALRELVGCMERCRVAPGGQP